LVYVIFTIISFILALILTPFLRWMAVKKHFLDYPGKRKIHKEAVPRLGGIAIAASFIITTFICISYKPEIYKNLLALIALLIGALIILIWGFWDDLRGMKAWVKFLGQFLSVLVVIPSGFIIYGFSIPYVSNFVEFGWWLSISFTFFWIIGITNTINFIDGMDGLAAGTTIIISIGLFILSIFTGQIFMAIICLILTGSILGFLRYNFHPATIFMGDCGAMFLGFMLALISIKVVFHNQSIIASSVVSVLLFGLPIVDSSWAIIRRIARGQLPSRADDEHTHHRLMRLGFSQRKVAFILYLVSSISVASGIFVALAGSDTLAIIVPIIMLTIALTGIMLLIRLSASVKAEN
jgi:UDP-GlcNAc:undecaprenyl-phosphate GlcNAc-1-phosphate transferase